MFKSKTIIMHKFVSLSRCALKVNKTVVCMSDCVCSSTFAYKYKSSKWLCVRVCVRVPVALRSWPFCEPHTCKIDEKQPGSFGSARVLSFTLFSKVKSIYVVHILTPHVSHTPTALFTPDWWWCFFWGDNSCLLHRWRLFFRDVDSLCSNLL